MGSVFPEGRFSLLEFLEEEVVLDQMAANILPVGERQKPLKVSDRHSGGRHREQRILRQLVLEFTKMFF